jgi:hypothetical protein
MPRFVMALVGTSLALLLVVPYPRVTRAGEAEIPTLPLALHVARSGDHPVVDAAWIETEIAIAEQIFSVHGVHFKKVTERALEVPDSSAPPANSPHARLESRADRDALASELDAKVVNVFLVESLRDVDDPSLYRMGVYWQNRAHPEQRYVIVVADAKPSVLAHELGHYFGNPHSPVVNNLMSYHRSGDAIFLDDAQGRIIQRSARTFLANHTLAPAAEWTVDPSLRTPL